MKMLEQIGIHKNVPNEVYHKSPGISSSGISLILDCPKRYWYQYLSNEASREDTRSMLIGQALHTMVLEPDTFNDRFIVLPELDRRTKAGKEAYEQFINESQGKIVLPSSDYESAKQMADNVKAHRMYEKIYGVGNIEDSCLWKDKDTGVLLRSRPDYYNDFLIIDVKTTKDASPQAFASSMATYGYHRQAAMACDALTELTGCPYETVIQFVVENTAPYLVAAYAIKQDAIELGRKQYKEGARIYAECMRTNNWPGYPEILTEIDLPNWFYYREQNNVANS